MSALRKLADIVQLGKNADIGALVDALADLVLTQSGAAQEELGRLLSDVTLGAFPKLSPATRLKVSGQVGSGTFLSKPLALRLAGEPVDIATPVLRGSPVLSEHDLSELAPQLSDEHLCVIAAHRAAGPELARVIACHGGENTLCALVLNASSAPDDETLEFLAGRSENMPLLAEALKEAGCCEPAPELASESASEIVPEVAEAIPDDPAVENAVSEVLEPTGTVATARPILGKHLMELVEDVRSRRLKTGDAIAGLIENNDAKSVAPLLAVLGDLPWIAGSSMLFRADDRLICAACRFMDVDPKIYETLVDLRGKHLGLTDMERSEALRRYKALPEKMAATILIQRRVQASIANLSRDAG